MASPDGEGRAIIDLQVPATVEGMDAVHSAVGGCWLELELPEPLARRWCDEISLAVAEVAANIIQHAHPPEAPLVDFALTLTRFPDRLVARFVDRGTAATPPDGVVMPSVSGPYDELGERGRGLAIVQMTTDRFEYQRTADGENVWIIEKDFPA